MVKEDIVKEPQLGFTIYENEPDYEGFVRHLDEMVEAGCPIGRKDLIRLAEKYHTPIPSYIPCVHSSSAYKKINEHLERCRYCGNEREIR